LGFPKLWGTFCTGERLENQIKQIKNKVTFLSEKTTEQAKQRVSVGAAQ